MTSVPTDKIRNVALVGHGGSGKTTLAEALLARAGAINRIGPGRGRHDRRRHRARGAEAAASRSRWPSPRSTWEGHKINLIDTPGYADFVGDVRGRAAGRRPRRVRRAARSTASRCRPRRSWRLAAELGVPRMVFVNKLDRERADFERTLDQLRDVFGAGIAPLELPIGAGGGLPRRRRPAHRHGLRLRRRRDPSARTRSPTTWPTSSTRSTTTSSRASSWPTTTLLERYLEGDVPSVEELEHTLADGRGRRPRSFPVVCGSAVDRRRPSTAWPTSSARSARRPLDRPVTVVAGDTETEVAADAGGQPLAFVFKTIADPYVGQLSLFKVLSGTIKADDHLVNPRTGTDERLHGLFHLRGKEQVPTSPRCAPATSPPWPSWPTPRTGDTLAPKGTPVRRAAGRAPPAGARRGHQGPHPGRRRQAGHRPSTACQEEDPALRAGAQRRDPPDAAAGHRRDAPGRHPRAAAAQVRRQRRHRGRPGPLPRDHHRQGRGRGQVQEAVAAATASSASPGCGSSRSSAAPASSSSTRSSAAPSPASSSPRSQKGIEETMSHGGVHGFPVVDVRVECFDGKYHSVDSSEMSFKMAGSLGFKEAMAKAGAGGARADLAAQGHRARRPTRAT